MIVTEAEETQPIVWHGCYDGGWKGIIIPEAFAHPAKFSRPLIQRILDYGLQRGYWKRGETIGDCFGGVGLGGIEAAYRGLRWIGNELEEKFVSLARQNFGLHCHKWQQLGLPEPVITQGDSRQFDTVVNGVVTSPPYGTREDGSGIAQNGDTSRSRGGSKLGRSILAAVISSPPYAEISAGAGGLNTKPAKHVGQQSGRKNGASQDTDQRYGESDGQIARCASGKLSAVISSPPYYGDTPGQIGTLKAIVTSPPWENNCEGKIGAQKWRDPDAAAATMSRQGKGNYASPEARRAQFERDAEKTYGDSVGQIGKEQGETYWQAMLLVYAACYRSIKPGGYIAVVVKDYVKNKQRIRLCDDTQRLLEHIGFESIERIHAMLVEEMTHETLFGETQTTKRERKSFFRRLAEKKGSPRIDYEEVLICRRPVAGKN